MNKQEFLEQVTLQKRARQDCGGQETVCDISGSAGRHCYSGLLFIIPGHVRKVKVKSTESLNKQNQRKYKYPTLV